MLLKNYEKLHKSNKSITVDVYETYSYFCKFYFYTEFFKNAQAKEMVKVQEFFVFKPSTFTQDFKSSTIC